MSERVTYSQQQQNKPRPAHGEAQVVIFGDIVVAGRKFTVTLREGATLEEALTLLDIAEELVRRTAANSQAEQPNAQPGRAPRRDDQEGVAEVDRVVVAGTREKPVVEMYSTGLRYPVLRASARWLTGYFLNQFGRAPDWLMDVGHEQSVAWTVEWRRTEKGYKNIVSIRRRQEA